MSNGIDTFEVQKDIIHYVTVNEVLTQYLSQKVIPSFKQEKADNYRRIMRQFAKLEIENSTNQNDMWMKVMINHADKAAE